MLARKNEKFGMIKTLMDAHTMGIHAGAALLRECGYKVIISTKQIEDAVEKIYSENYQKLLLEWIEKNTISHLGFSYRLDPDNAVEFLGRLVVVLKKAGLYETQSAIVKSIFFAGLTSACDRIDEEYNGRIRTLRGGESVEETLSIMGIPEENIPPVIIEGCKYDKELIKFGDELIKKGEYLNIRPLKQNMYPEFGTFKDTLVRRLDYNFEGGFQPLIRAHSGPFSVELTRQQCLKEYNTWCHQLANTGYLDVLSIGTSQLSQSNFGEDWSRKMNGGGVPVNSEKEYYDIWEASNPMLVRTYSATKNVMQMAKVYERSINNAWHALSLWWFNELDGRGPNTLFDNLKEHINTISYIATVGKPVETNVPHHFAFRGCDDITYIVSAYLAAKVVKKCGVRTFVLQNMLNTPRSTWGIQDLAKSRALLELVQELQDSNFRVIFQTRAGLDYFKPSLDKAKVQLAAVTALMDDIEPNNNHSPEIIHVVSYSEALFLATPNILNDSIKITRAALAKYRKMRKLGMTPDVMTDEIKTRTVELSYAARKVIKAMEDNIPGLYTPEGLYIAFTAGFLPVPELWSDSDEFLHAKCWETKVMNGGVVLIDHGLLMTVDARINRAVSYIPDAQYILKHKYGRN